MKNIILPLLLLFVIFGYLFINNRISIDNLKHDSSNTQTATVPLPIHNYYQNNKVDTDNIDKINNTLNTRITLPQKNTKTFYDRVNGYSIDVPETYKIIDTSTHELMRDIKGIFDKSAIIYAPGYYTPFELFVFKKSLNDAINIWKKVFNTQIVEKQYLTINNNSAARLVYTLRKGGNKYIAYFIEYDIEKTLLMFPAMEGYKDIPFTVKSFDNTQTTTNINTAGTQINETSCVDLHRNLFLSTAGPDVMRLQKYLQKQGFYTYPKITGYFGPATQQAVQRFQCAKMGICSGLPWTNGYGVVGPMTRDKMACFSQTQQIGGHKFKIITPRQDDMVGNTDFDIKWSWNGPENALLTIAGILTACYEDDKLVYFYKDLPLNQYNSVKIRVPEGRVVTKLIFNLNYEENGKTQEPGYEVKLAPPVGCAPMDYPMD